MCHVRASFLVDRLSFARLLRLSSSQSHSNSVMPTMTIVTMRKDNSASFSSSSSSSSSLFLCEFKKKKKRASGARMCVMFPYPFWKITPPEELKPSEISFNAQRTGRSLLSQQRVSLPTQRRPSSAYLFRHFAPSFVAERIYICMYYCADSHRSIFPWWKIIHSLCHCDNATVLWLHVEIYTCTCNCIRFVSRHLSTKFHNLDER